MNQGMGLLDHLTELRTRLIKIAYIVFIGSLVCWFYSEYIFNFVRMPIEPYLPAGGLIYTGVVDKFTAHIKVALMAGTILTSPFWFYQIWLFVAPGLYRNEKKYAAMFLGSAVSLFLVGVTFVYKLVFPMAFKFLFSFGGTVDKPMITIEEYLSFFTLTSVLFGICFELPLIITVLGWFGIVNATFLRAQRRYAIVILAVISAVVTPPDALSMLFLLVPLVFLYEVSILVVGRIEKTRQVSNTDIQPNAAAAK